MAPVMLLVSAASRRVEYYVRNAEGDWDVAVLDSSRSLPVRCGDYRAELTVGELYANVRLSV